MAISPDISYIRALSFFCGPVVVSLGPLNWGRDKSGSALKLTRYVRSVA
jgi:hypothetical protein